MTPLLLAAVLGAEPAVGFIWHYPFAGAGDELVARCGVTHMTARAPWAAIEPEPGRFEFGALAEQLALARAGGYRLVLILECNPFCAPPWLRRQVLACGEQVVGAGGAPDSLPSTSSPTYWAAVERFLGALTGWLAEHDRELTVVAYHPGIEWWFPSEYRHAPADITRYQAQSGTTVDPPRLFPPDLFRRGRDGLAEFELAAPWPHGDAEAACRDWYWFWVETAAATLERLAATVKRLDPGRETISFQTFAWATAGEWDYLAWSATPPVELARLAPSLDAIGLQVPLAGGDAHQISVALDLVRKLGKPLWALDLLDFTQGQAAGWPVMRRGIHAAVQHGATAINFCSWAGAGDYSFYPAWPVDDIAQLSAEALGALAAVAGLAPRAEGALLLPFVPPGPAGVPNDPASFAGFYRLLESIPLTVDLVSFRELELGTVDLGRYPWLLLPDAPLLPEPVAAALRGYHGRLFATQPLPGATLLPDLGRAYAAALHRDSFAGDGPPMILWRDFPPTATVDELRRLMQQAGVETTVTLEPHRPEVTCTVLRGDGELALYLVNRGVGPLGPTRCRLRLPPPRTLRLWADLTPAAGFVGRDGQHSLVYLPPFETSCIVRLGLARPAPRRRR